jgi:hypothetical protein
MSVVGGSGGGYGRVIVRASSDPMPMVFPSGNAYQFRAQ